MFSDELLHQSHLNKGGLLQKVLSKIVNKEVDQIRNHVHF